MAVDQLLESIVGDLTGEALAARERVVAEAAAATRLSRIVVSAAVLVGALLTVLLLRSIVVPLHRLVVAMDGLNAGNVDVPIPEAGADEIGAVARTLAKFRDTLTEERRRERELRAAHDELKAAQASLIQAEKMASLGQLTAGIAHEIKNPLNFVNNFASLSVELLDELKAAARPAIAALGEDKRADVDEVVEMLTSNLQKIAEHGRRADGIVKSMLEHSRGGTGERRRVDLNGLIEEALNLAYHGARAQDQSFNITLERNLDRAITLIELAPQDVTRVFLNLFGNGFYAANKRRKETNDPQFKPSLKVTTRDLGEAVEIRVRDNGTGIPPELRDRLFQPFFTTKPTGEGTGLGLSISWDIVTQQHGGTIAVDSEVGEFTEFTIRLPRSRQSQPSGMTA
jgi:signal transduction histidine kinase